MPALEAIGRTNTLRAVTGDLQRFAQDQRNQGLREREFALKEQAVKSNLADVEFKRQQAQEQAKIANKPIPVEMISNAFPVPEVAQYAQKFASALGYVEDINGVPTIRAGKAKEIYGLLHQGDHPQVISGITVNHYRNQVSQIKTQLAELQQSGKDLSKDKNAAALTQALKQAQMGLVSSLENADRLDTYSGYVKQGYAPENVQKAMETGDMSLLGEPVNAASGERSSYFTPVQTSTGIYVLNARTGELEKVKEPGGEPVLPVSADVGLAGSKKEAEKTGGNIADVNVEQYNTATAAVNQIKDIDRLINHIDSSEAITGFGAEILKNLQRVKAAVGGDATKVTDTELLDVMMGSEVFPMIKALGVGARGLDTPAEREFMRKVLTGSLTLNKNTLRRMAEIRKNVAMRAIDKWNSRVEGGELDRFFESSGIQKKKIGAGDSTGRVKVVSPDGQVGSIPESQLEEALSNGYRRQ